ncbi:hypothetical protein BU26DRAFT_523807 [Trematosphaeria pertusa]|uniref:Uncharacterized protein n=1 Tax=Trematosphaeria pertusa TaxID=390896 RepID=A0A6A6HZ62_9PLEO|nr:uncharacterized protein BU26DRAFT_523807 [Trematosphaeria pertusa]KAF2243524.1 hypothetical protein BU26DRAFT_523807 [Trematosphaeria pertusa]
MSSFASGFANFYLEGIDSLPLEHQYRLLRDLPGGRFLSPEVKLRMYRDGVPASSALLARRLGMEPVGVNSLPRHLWNEQCLIDFDHWAGVNEQLSKRGGWIGGRYVLCLTHCGTGVKLPCEYVSGTNVSDTASTLGSIRSRRAVTNAGVGGTGAGDEAAFRVERRSERAYERAGEGDRKLGEEESVLSETWMAVTTRGMMRLLAGYGMVFASWA